MQRTGQHAKCIVTIQALRLSRLLVGYYLGDPSTTGRQLHGKDQMTVRAGPSHNFPDTPTPTTEFNHRPTSYLERVILC